MLLPQSSIIVGGPHGLIVNLISFNILPNQQERKRDLEQGEV